ncbi:DinB family protein [Duganella qianjiadongensis]|uniref:Damage-inducible protein DinB n=1 Tax=Duganella qianjiadongensis TaxID=2692176 RepID=A0ABW9VL11_9BURK|nr:DinB family protein [Duganella qianjiadongensis]MYM40296.1 damage-inducible protein DinB [Duganella qianjiadongensis]
MLIRAFNYKQWADQRTLDAAQALATRDGAAAVAFICQQLNHMVIVEELFRARLLGETLPHQATNTAVVPPLEELGVRLARSNQWLAQFVADAREEVLQKQIPLRFMDGQPGRLSALEALFHIINHGTYHRGAIGHALDLAGAARPADTYTVYIHAAEPQRRLA